MKETVEHNNRFYKQPNGEILTESEQLKEWLIVANKENERLNNIINNIENDLLDRYYGRGKYHLSTDIIGIPTFYRRIKELKGSDKE